MYNTYQILILSMLLVLLTISCSLIFCRPNTLVLHFDMGVGVKKFKVTICRWFFIALSKSMIPHKEYQITDALIAAEFLTKSLHTSFGVQRRIYTTRRVAPSSQRKSEKAYPMVSICHLSILLCSWEGCSMFLGMNE